MAKKELEISPAQDAPVAPIVVMSISKSAKAQEERSKQHGLSAEQILNMTYATATADLNNAWRQQVKVVLDQAILQITEIVIGVDQKFQSFAGSVADATGIDDEQYSEAKATSEIAEQFKPPTLTPTKAQEQLQTIIAGKVDA